MRTETLLLTAAIGVAAAATTMAQVYSVNAVGYVNVTLKAKVQMIANPLDAGTGNNTVAKLLAGVPDGTFVYVYDATSKQYVGASIDFGEWTGGDLVLAPGTGAFVILPPDAADTKVTFVGEVALGAASNMPLVNGVQLVGSKVPQAGKLVTDLKFPSADGDFIYRWNYAGQTYDGFSQDFGEWSPAEPTVGDLANIGVAEGFWAIKNGAASWDRNFSIATP